MATRNALRIVSRRFSSGKILSEEVKAAVNLFIKKMEQGKLEKIARQGPGEQAASGSASGANGSGATSKASAESGPKVSEDKNRKLRGIRRSLFSGKVLSEEERAAENVFIKKMEKEKLEKIARQGPGEAAAAGSASGANATGATSTASAESGPKVSEDKNRNYAVVAGVVTVFGAIGWYLKSGGKKQPEVQE